MKTTKQFLIIVALLISSCAIIKNYPQESKFMKVSGGGSIMRKQEMTYGAVINFKNLPDNAKYLIADFEIPNNAGLYDRKVFSLTKNQTKIVANSDPVYGVDYGFYSVKLYLAEDKKGEKIIDSLEQSIKLFMSPNKGRDYASQYTFLEGGKEIKKVLLIYPNNRKKELITAEVPNEFKLGHAGIGFDESIAEYVPNSETVFNWTKIITLKENKAINKNVDKSAIYAAALGNGLYQKFSKLDKDIQVTYAGIVNGEFVNSDNPNFQKLIMDANEVGLYIDYADYEVVKKLPYQREYLVARIIKSDISIWEFQCTVRYDKRWSKEKIESLKKKAKNIVATFQRTKSNPIDNIDKAALEGGINDFDIKTQRLDDGSLNEKFKEEHSKSIKN